MTAIAVLDSGVPVVEWCALRWHIQTVTA